MLIIGTFNVGDFAGRFIPFCEKAILTNPAYLWGLTALRFVLVIPLIILLVNDIIESDVLAFILVFFL